ncbi:glucose-6-phosphate dehydrogenase [Micromonospora acroterricola]|uniref:Glucose-6-phosphate 1-dehydrogenase n=1 Tax=Micromonospora acroterricola TaxID=2202421 RepID=A0A317D8R5_9ACTN|nr:glucose-6-phosphate dehydrogenase [Micromonospora acroterricola]PWR09025.1 glucose-6-phosphate dehydrogenase [Micromonospora acroterricola]
MTTSTPSTAGSPADRPAGGSAVPRTLLLLGASGDLAARLLLPGLGRLVASGALPNLRLIGSGTHAWDDGQWRRRVADSFATAGADGPRETEVVRSARYLPADVTAEEDLRRLLAACHGQTVIFFALPPAITARAADALARIGLPPGTRLMLEKPFGTDLASARSLNDILTRLVPEEQVHRIDHFLGKSTVVNIIGLRFANRIFEPVLNSEHVACVDIVFDESLGLEGRAGYYDSAGALVDMVQSHLLQVLALMAMDAPPTLDARDLRGRKAQVLRATRLWDGDPVRWSRRARYTAGEVDGRRLLGYADEAGIDATRGTETLAELVLAVDTWRWAGVPFRLRSGKALAGRRKEAVITFRQPPRVPTGLTGYEQPDRLRIGFGPDRLGLDVNINGPGNPLELDQVHLVADFGPGELPPYGEVLRGAFDGDPTLSVRGDTAEDCWRIVEPVLDAWRAGKVPLQEYPAGSQGLNESLLAPAPGGVI